MWLLTSDGFYAIVQKSGENELCIRARDAGDLDRLRSRYLPTLTETLETRGGDYRYRAWVSRDALAEGLAAIVRDLDYANFKDEVARRDSVRAHIYGEVWGVLGEIQPGGPYS
jgi:hypothetical protein